MAKKCNIEERKSIFNEKISEVDVCDNSLELLEVIREKQKHIRNIIRWKLVNDMRIKDKEKIKILPGRAPDTAYRNYVWQEVIVGEIKYCISMFANDVDINSRNIHMRIGHIQFCKDEPSNHLIDEKNGKKRDGDYYLMKIGYPELSEVRNNPRKTSGKARNPGKTIDDIKSVEDIEELTEAFYKFLKDCGEKESDFLKDK